MKKKVSLVLAGSIMLSLIAILGGCNTLDTPFRAAERYEYKGDYERAIVEWTKVITNMTPPNNYLIYQKRGNCYHRIRDYANAEADYLVCIREGIRYMQLHPNLRSGITRTITEVTEQLYDIALRQVPEINLRLMVLEWVPGVTVDEERWITYAIVALAFYEAEAFNKAIRYCTDGLRLKPDYQDLLVLRAHCYWEIKDYDKSIADYSTAIEFNPNDSGLYEARGGAYVSRLLNDDIDKAIADFNKALGIEPDYVDALVSRGFAYMLKSDLMRARADVDAALQLDPDNDRAKQILALLQRQ